MVKAPMVVQLEAAGEVLVAAMVVVMAVMTAVGIVVGIAEMETLVGIAEEAVRLEA